LSPEISCFNALAAHADYNSAFAMWLKATGRVR
jgi:hypothetical protein